MGILAAALAAGCAYRTPPVHFARSIPQVAPGQLDVSTVAVLRDGSSPPAREVEEIDRWATEMLQAAAVERGSRGNAARVRLRVEVEPQWHLPAMDPLSLSAFLLASVLGLAVESQEVSVTLELESLGRTLRGHGSGRIHGGLYAPARRRALALALDQALAQAHDADAGP